MATKLSPVGSQFTVNLVTADNQESPDITPLSDGRFVVVYESEDPPNEVDVLGQFVNADGTLSGTTISIAVPPGFQGEPAAAARSDGGFTTVWSDAPPLSQTASIPDIYYAVTNSAGTVTVPRTLLMDSVFD